MNNQDLYKIESYFFLSIVIILLSIGTIMMYSASSSFAYYKFNRSDTYFLFKHFLWVVLGMMGLFSLSFINHYIFKN